MINLIQNEAVLFIRKAIGRSQRGFADAIGVKTRTITSVETGRRRLTSNIARKIEDCTGASAEHLLRGEAVAVDGQPYTKKWFDEWLPREHSRRIELIEDALRQAVAGAKKYKPHPLDSPNETVREAELTCINKRSAQRLADFYKKNPDALRR